MSSDVSWHIRDKLWPMPKHGSIILYVHGNQRFVRTDSPGRPPWLSHSSWTMSTVKTSVSLALQLTVSSTTNCATERDHAGLCLREPPKLYSSFLRMPSATGFTIQASATGASSATMTINYDYKLPPQGCRLLQWLSLIVSTTITTAYRDIPLSFEWNIKLNHPTAKRSGTRNKVVD